RLLAERHRQRDDVDAVGLGLGRIQVRRRIGHEGNAGHSFPPPDPQDSRSMIRGRRHRRPGIAAPRTERLRFREMDRSLWAVMAGTFTLRFSTGLTGAMLGVYLAKLPEHGGEAVQATTLGLLSASFFLSELVLSPAFGILSDRIGHHRVMLFGPVFGAIAVILTGL